MRGWMQNLVTRGQRFAEATFFESKHVNATALIETDQDLITLTVPSSSFEDGEEEDARAVFRQAVDQVVAQSVVSSVIVIAEVWFQVESRLSSGIHPPLRNLRREAVVVHVETANQFSVTLSEIDRFNPQPRLGPWRSVSSIYLPGLTGFLPKMSDLNIN
jgi:hypothetical protein